MAESHCSGEADTVVLQRITALLQQRLRRQDRQGQENRQSQLAQKLTCLSPTAARALHARLIVSHPRDPLTRSFLGLPPLHRQAVIEILQQTANTAPPLRQGVDPALEAALLPVLAKTLYLNEVWTAVAQVRHLTATQQYERALQVLASLRQIVTDPRFTIIATDPRFTIVNRAVLDAVTVQTDRLITALQRRGSPLLLPRRREAPDTRPAGVGIAGAAVATIGATIGWKVVAVIALTAAAITAVNALMRRDAALYRPYNATEDEQFLRDYPQIIEKLWPSPQLLPIPTLPPFTPEESEQERRRCSQEWVPRPYAKKGTKQAALFNYHQRYAAAIVTRLRFPGVNPEMEYRIHRGSGLWLDYDSYDPSEDAYYEFKTRYHYLKFEGLKVTEKKKNAFIGWMARSNFFTQAMLQRETLVACGLDEAQIIWVFQDREVAKAVAGYLPVDRVRGEPWSSVKQEYP